MSMNDTEAITAAATGPSVDAEDRIWNDDGQGLIIIKPDGETFGIDADELDPNAITASADDEFEDSGALGRLAIEDLELIAQRTAEILTPVVASAGQPDCGCEGDQGTGIQAAVAQPGDGGATQPDGDVVKDPSTAMVEELRTRIATLEERIASLETDLAMVIASSTPDVTQLG